MMICEHFPQVCDWKVEIPGTDFSAEVIARAQAGRYQRHEVHRGLSAHSLLKYARRTGNEWEMVPKVRHMCRFQQRNLCNGPMLVEKFDGILLRNFMLYFSIETRQKLLADIHRILAPDGFLILGSSEQPDLPTLFQPVVTSSACFYKPIVQQAGW
jgi:chemotaxis protein methyltransferase CheR